MAAKRKPETAAPLPASAGRTLTLDEAAARVGEHCSRFMLRQEISRGRLKALRVGNRRIAIRIEALEAWLRQREDEGVAV